MNWKGFTLTDEEERAIDLIIERELGPAPAPPEPVQAPPVPERARVNKPNPEALQALYDRLIWFLMTREGVSSDDLQ